MNHKMFSIYDEKAQAFLPPFVLHREEMAKRTFSDAINDKNHAFGRHPSDYTLFILAEFNDEKGTIIESKRSIGNGVEFIRPDLADDKRELFADLDTEGTQQLKVRELTQEYANKNNHHEE